MSLSTSLRILLRSRALQQLRNITTSSDSQMRRLGVAVEPSLLLFEFTFDQQDLDHKNIEVQHYRMPLINICHACVLYIMAKQ